MNDAEMARALTEYADGTNLTPSTARAIASRLETLARTVGSWPTSPVDARNPSPGTDTTPNPETGAQEP